MKSSKLQGKRSRKGPRFTFQAHSLLMWYQNVSLRNPRERRVVQLTVDISKTLTYLAHGNPADRKLPTRAREKSMRVRPRCDRVSLPTLTPERAPISLVEAASLRSLVAFRPRTKIRELTIQLECSVLGDRGFAHW